MSPLDIALPQARSQWVKGVYTIPLHNTSGPTKVMLPILRVYCTANMPEVLKRKVVCSLQQHIHKKRRVYVLGVWTDLNPYHVLPHTFHLHAHTWWDETQCGKRKSQKLILVLLPCSSVELHGTWAF